MIGGGGGGGGGGGHAITDTGISNTDVLQGGNGGNGGGSDNASYSGEYASGGGGGGGAGGYGAVITGGSAASINAGEIHGGNGGNGGTPLSRTGGGDGGDGRRGIGVELTVSGAAFTNDGVVTGGDGGKGGSGGAGGDGGVGILGATTGEITIVNGGTIAGGQAASGEQANAITFAGDNNRLELHNGFNFVGDVVASGGTGNVLALGGVSNANFDVSKVGAAQQYRGFSTFEKAGASTWTLTGTTTAVTPWTISDGTLSISSDANLGDISGDLTLDGSTLQTTGYGFLVKRDITLNAGGGTFQTDNGSASVALTGTVSGSGSLTKTGSSLLVLQATNTYTGGTNIIGGSLSLTETGALGTGPVTVGSGTELIFGNGSGGAENLSLTANGGTISFSSGTSADAATITNNAGEIAFGDGSTAGTTTITNNAGGDVSFHVTSTADDATIVNNAGGMVDISNVDAGIGIGSLSGDGKVIFGSKTLTLGGLGLNDTIGGIIQEGGGFKDGTGGSLIKTGTGTLTLTGANSYTGGTAVEGGTLQIGDGGTAGSIMGDVDIVSGGTFAFNRSDNIAFAGALSGAGHFVQAGAGVLFYDGDGSAFAGNTTVEDGSLIVGSDTALSNTTLGGSFDVQDGGMLGGHGTVGSGAGSTVTVSSGGTIAPGNSIGTLTVDGDITFNTGSIYEAEINPALDSDLIDASGTATINGGTVYALKAGGVYTPDSRWTIVGADGGVTGEFDELDQNMPFVDLALAYDANHVYIDATRNDVAFCDVAGTFNQCSTGNGLESTGTGNPVYDAVAALPDEDSARLALDALSGEIHASVKSALIEDSHFVRDAVNDRIRSAFGDATGADMALLAYGEGGPQPTTAGSIGPVAWGYAFGSWGSFDGDGNAAGMDTSTGGFLTGIDGEVASNIRLGILAGYSQSSFDIDDRASSGSSDNYHVGLYAGGKWDALRLTGGLAYTWHDIGTNRSVAFPGFSDSLKGNYNAGTFQAFGEAGYKIDAGAVSFEPFANLAYVSLHTDGFTEQGGAAALHMRSATTDATFTTLGAHVSSTFDLGTMRAIAHGTLGWRHAFGDITPLSAHNFAGGDAFDIAGVPIAKDAALIEAGFDLDITEAAILGIAYQGQFGSGAMQNGVKAKLQVQF